MDVDLSEDDDASVLDPEERAILERMKVCLSPNSPSVISIELKPTGRTSALLGKDRCEEAGGKDEINKARILTITFYSRRSHRY